MRNAKDNRQKSLVTFASVSLLVAGVTSLILVYFFMTPKTDVAYFSRAMDKIGAPEGFYTKGPDYVRNNPFQSTEVHRYYHKDVNLPDAASLRMEMIERLQKVGFENTVWRDVPEPGVTAHCKSLTIFVRVYQKGSPPINIDIYGSSDSSAPRCPDL